MNAKEMFKKLGYEYVFINECGLKIISYYVSTFEGRPLWDISFDLYWKEINVNTHYGTPKSLSVDEVKVIIQQCKELGWLDE